MQSLDECLNNDKLYNQLMEIANKQYCSENLLFLKEVSKFEKLGSNQLKDEANRIFQSYFVETAEYLLNVSQEVTNNIQQNLNNNNVDKNLFEAARVAIHRLVEDGIYEVWKQQK